MNPMTRRSLFGLGAAVIGVTVVRVGQGQSAQASATSAVNASGQTVITGSAESTPYGDAQIKVTLSGTKIVDVVAVALPSREQRSVEIGQSAEPILRKEVLAANSADVDIVSGATYTSEAYLKSLQSALDKA